MMRESCAYYHNESVVVIERLCHPAWMDAYVRVSASVFGEVRPGDAGGQPRSSAELAARVEAPGPGGGRASTVGAGQPRGLGRLAC
jgi:hypothetical protein